MLASTSLYWWLILQCVREFKKSWMPKLSWIIYVPSDRKTERKENNRRNDLKKPKSSTPVGSYKSFSINSTPREHSYRSSIGTMFIFYCWKHLFKFCLVFVCDVLFGLIDWFYSKFNFQINWFTVIVFCFFKACEFCKHIGKESYNNSW